MRSSSIASPSSWWNIGTCVASAVSGRYTRPGHHDVDRRLLELHRAHLHRRGVRAQQHLLGEVEGVLRQPRRVLGRVVERREVVVLVLDLGALDDREAEPDAHVLHAPADLRDQVQVADRHGRVAGQRHVHAVLDQAAVQLGGLELRGAPLQQRLERLAHLVGLLADRAALLGRQLADRAQRLRSAPTCAPGSARAAPPARRPTRRRSTAASASVRSWARSAMAGHPIVRPRRGRCVAAIATLSDSAAPPGCAPRSALAARPAARPRSAPRQSTSGRRSARRSPSVRSPCALERQRVPAQLARSRPAPAAARTASPCSPAPPSASTGRRSRARGPPGRRRARARSG